MSSNIKNAIIAIIVVVLIGLSGFLYSVYSPNMSAARALPKSNMMNLPLISTQVKSEDGESHSVDTYISLEFTKETENLDSESLKRIVSDAVSSLEYEKIIKAGNISYIKEEVINKLDEYVSEDNLLGVYVTEIQSGDYRISSPLPESDNQTDPRSDVAKKLFKGMDN